jgi:uncharacterized linocin/CFP29 family protein
MQTGVAVHEAKTFLASNSGRWASERLAEALKEGRPLGPDVLRTLDTLQKNEWEHLDDAVISEGVIRLRAIADLIAAGLTINVPNAMGKTMFQWEKVSDMNPAEVSLSGIPRTEDDRVEFELGNLPLPIIHKDFNLNLRTLAASRSRGEALDTTQARIAGRLVSEELERMLFRGGKTFGGATIYGITNHPDRNTASFGTNGAWSAGAKTGENILTDVLTMIAALEADRMYGPYWLYVPSNSSVKLENDFKANSDKSIRMRLMEVDRLVGIRVVDQMPADNIALCQATVDVLALVNGEPLQTVQWDIEGGFIVKFKAFAIQVPLIRSDAQGRSGIIHMS